MSLATASKHDRRAALLSPHQVEHDASEAARFRHPQTLHDYVRELRAAVEAESVDRLHMAGVEAEAGPSPRLIATAIAQGRDIPRAEGGGSHLGTPKWSHDFRTYLEGSPFATYPDGAAYYWVHPLRSSVARMENDGSGITRLAARTVHALPFHRYAVRDTWWSLCGPFANGDAEYMAETWTHEALRRWYGFYVEQPMGKPLT